MGNKISKKILVGLMSVTLTASILSVGAVMQEKQVKEQPVVLAADGTEKSTVIPELDENKYEGFFADYSFNKPATGGSIVAYANGYKEYKTVSVYTDVRPTYIFTSKTDKNGKTTVKSTTSKLLITTSTNNKALDESGKKYSPFTEDGTKVNTKDDGVSKAKSIATASVRNGIVTVTGQKEEGIVYVWMKDSNPAITETYCIPATIKMAPKKLELYAETMDDEKVKAEGTKNITAGNINIGSSQDVYLYAYNIGSDKVKKGVYKDITFTAALDKKSEDYFDIQQDPNNSYKFSIKAKKLAEDTKVKDKVKQFTGKVTFTCDQSGAKTSFTVTVGNHVKEFGWKEQETSTDKVKCTDSGIQLAVVTTKSAITANLDLDVKSLMNSDYGFADKAVIKEISEDLAGKISKGEEIVRDKNGLPKETLKSSEKSGITASLSKNSDGLTLKAKKGIEVGKTGYFIVVFSGGTSGIIKVTTVETLDSK